MQNKKERKLKAESEMVPPSVIYRQNNGFELAGFGIGFCPVRQLHST
jgi:hypothetical protein